MKFFKKKYKQDETSYIAQKTLGKTNEISFSVLGAKLEKSEEKQLDPWDIQSTSNINVRRRQRRRAKMIVWLSAASFVLLLGLLVIYSIGGVIQTTSGTNDQLTKIMKETLTVSKDNDDIRSALDVSLNNEPSAISAKITAQNINNLVAKATKNINSLKQTKNELENLLNNIVVPSDKNNANGCLDLINNELEVCNLLNDVAKGYLNDYLTDRELASEAMDAIMDGDSADREASYLILQATNEAAQKAREKNQEALDENEKARSLFLNMTNANQKKFSDYLEFCQLRIEAQEASLKVVQAYIDRNKEELEAQNEVYNTKQEEATKIANRWTDEPKEVLDQEFVESRQSDSEKLRALISLNSSYKKTIEDLVNS